MATSWWRLCPAVLIAALSACTGDDGPPGADGAMGPAGPQGPPGATTTANVASRVTLIGETAHGGTTATLKPGGYTAVSDGAGGFSFVGVPIGIYTLEFEHGPFSESVADVLAFPGGSGFLVDRGLEPLEPIELARGRRLADGEFLSSVGAPRLSPAGNAVALREEDRTLVVDIESGDTLEFTNITPSYETPFSPDGTKFLYLDAPVFGVRSLELLDLGTKTAVKLGDAYDAGVLSPDGRTVLYLAAAVQVPQPCAQLRAVSVTGGTPRTLATLVGSWYRLAGTHAVYKGCNVSGELRSVPLAGGSTVLLAQQSMSDPILSPDGTHVVFRAATGEFEIVPVTGGAARPVSSSTSITALSFSPDGTHIAYTDGASGNALKLVPAQGGATVQVSTGSGYPYQFGSDGSLFFLEAATGVGGTLRHAPPSGEASVEIGEAFQFSVASHVEAGVLLGGVSGWSIQAPLGSATRPLFSGMGTAAFSPDGAKVAIADCYSACTVWTVPAAGGAHTPVISSASSWVEWVDGSRLLATRVEVPESAAAAGMFALTAP